MTKKEFENQMMRSMFYERLNDEENGKETDNSILDFMGIEEEEEENEDE